MERTFRVNDRNNEGSGRDGSWGYLPTNDSCFQFSYALLQYGHPYIVIFGATIVH